MAGDPSDVELMLRVKMGDRNAFSVLVQRYRKPLMNFIYRLTADRAASEDLTHEVFLKVFRAASKYEPRAGFSTWLYRIATNSALNYIRDHKPHLSCSIDDATEPETNPFISEVRDPRSLADDESIEKERIRQIRKALAGLPENQRLAVVLQSTRTCRLKRLLRY